MAVKIIDTNSASNSDDSIFGVYKTSVSKQGAAAFAGWCGTGSISYSISPMPIHRNV
jgi:hypothetical protein